MYYFIRTQLSLHNDIQSTWSPYLLSNKTLKEALVSHAAGPIGCKTDLLIASKIFSECHNLLAEHWPLHLAVLSEGHAEQRAWQGPWWPHCRGHVLRVLRAAQV